jgi:hypothetical protein
MNRMTRFKRTLMILLIGLSANTAQAFEAFVDRSQVSTLETFTLTLRMEGGSNAQPDFGPALKDFDLISGPSSSSRTNIVNGVIDSWTEYSVELRPNRPGELTIPPIRWGNDTSDPIIVQVSKPSAAQTRRINETVFFETEVSAESIFVQSQLIYTVRLFFAESIRGSFPEPPDMDDAVIKVLKAENKYNTFINNRRYYVQESQYAIYPQTSGELVIPPEKLEGQISGRGLLSRRQHISVKSTGHTITVKPKPASLPSDQWLPAKSVTLSAQWSSNPPSFIVGEPINLNLILQASEVPASLLPPLEIDSLPRAKVYMDPPQTDEVVKDTGLSATRIETIVIVPTETGQLVIPEIKVHWWNTSTNRPQTSTLPSSTYMIRPGATYTQPTAPVQLPSPQPEVVVAAPNPYWIYLSIGLALGWLFTLVLWWRTRRQLSVAVAQWREKVVALPPSEKELFRALISACKSGKPAQIRTAMLTWARTHWPKHRIQSVDDIKKLNADLALEVKKMDRQLYSPGEQGQWDSAELISRLEQARKSWKDSENAKDNVVQALYP